MLSETDLPKFWYNINADSPVPPAPVLHPGTKEPVTPDFLSVLFPMELILQEISTERYIEIPEEVREIYKLYRPTPLIRARRLEKALGTPAHIYYKYEGVSPVGSHKPNTAIPQAFYNKIAGTKALTTETGAGQWGSALAMACSFFDIDLEVYMVKVSYNQKPYRRILMETYGAQVFASPTDRTHYGRSLLAEDPDSPGSLGIAISEAVEVAATSGGAKKYSLGSVLNHVLLHQTVIGEEALKQMDLAGRIPGCGDRLRGRRLELRRHRLPLPAREPARRAAHPPGGGRAHRHALADQGRLHLRLRRYRPDGADRQDAHPRPRLRPAADPRRRPALSRHGAQPLRAVRRRAISKPVAVPQLATFEAAVQFARAEGIVPAPESAHAIRGAIDEALDAKAKGEKRVILFNLSGHGNFDMTSYQAYFDGKLEDYEYPVEAVQEAMDSLPQVPAMV